MRLVGIRVIRLDTGGPLGLWRAMVRAALLVAFIPALITNRDNRGLHDLAAGAVVVRA
jgi:uncharacterized RDD family membrane protein YckC